MEPIARFGPEGSNLSRRAPLARTAARNAFIAWVPGVKHKTARRGKWKLWVGGLVPGNFNQLGMDRMDNLLKDHTWNGFARFFDGLCISVLEASPLCWTGHSRQGASRKIRNKTTLPLCNFKGRSLLAMCCYFLLPNVRT